MKGNRSGDGMRVVQAELMSAVKSGAAEAYPQLVRVAGLSAADRLKVRTYTYCLLLKVRILRRESMRMGEHEGEHEDTAQGEPSHSCVLLNPLLNMCGKDMNCEDIAQVMIRIMCRVMR
jgi:hypothetical protein